MCILYSVGHKVWTFWLICNKSEFNKIADIDDKLIIMSNIDYFLMKSSEHRL